MRAKVRNNSKNPPQNDHAHLTLRGSRLLLLPAEVSRYALCCAPAAAGYPPHLIRVAISDVGGNVFIVLHNLRFFLGFSVVGAICARLRMTMVENG